jgi:DDE superfamily endonuclease
MEPPDALHAFRRSFYDECLHRRGDALFELADAILTADGAAPSPVHLSLQASHRRGWGSLYAALDRGRIDDEAQWKLLACHPLAGTEGEVPVFAVESVPPLRRSSKIGGWLPLSIKLPRGSLLGNSLPRDHQTYPT